MSLVRLTRRLAGEGWDVTLVLSTAGGSLEDRVDPRVRLVRLRDRVFGARFVGETRALRKAAWAVLDGAPFLISLMQWLWRALQLRLTAYDAAVISLQGLSPALCCRWMRAHERVQWIRNDLEQCDGSGRAANAIKRYDRNIDAYVCVSETALQSLTRLFPNTTRRAQVIYNILDVDEMRGLATGPDPYEATREKLRVLTVCRLADEAKGLLRMVRVHRRLRDEGVDFLWYVIGDGPDRTRLAAAVAAEQMADRFFLLGSRANPFPYYRYADVVAVLSHYEGLCGVVNEAKVVGRPVIATRFSGVAEQLTQEENGLIVENDEEAIHVGMARILTDSALRERLTNAALPQDILDDGRKVALLERLIDGRQPGSARDTGLEGAYRGVPKKP